MIATCPTCATADEAVAVPEALSDTDRPLDPPTRELLEMLPEPRRTSGGAVTLFVLAGICGVRGLFGLGSYGGRSPDPWYQFGYQFGPFVFAAVLLSIGLVLQSNHREKHRHTAGRWPQTYEQWQQLREVWRATWLCRRCQVAFLPAASPGIPLAQFWPWTVAVARRGERPGR
ncbi:hypothetical protein [Streptomyces sp. Y1]|uniref:DUF3180 domain-containing protein n=1 Tax=Streptomyces sp. Y1 TaxID=3238634 RepID=A0AB39TWG9_9ACTN